MGKKSRRARAKHRAVVAKVVQEGNPQQVGHVSAKVQSSTRLSPKSQDFTSHYQYVIPEIKRIGLIAGSIIVVLIVLSFILG
jgi:hypothetical protein